MAVGVVVNFISMDGPLMSHDLSNESSLSSPDELPILGICKELIRFGRANGAVEQLKKAIIMSPNDWRLRNALGEALSEAGRGEEAIGAFIAALELKPDCAALCVKIGRAFFLRGLTPPALFWLRRAMQIDADCETAIPLLAIAEAKGGCRESVADLLGRWIKANPTDPVRRHLATAILGDTPERPEDGYISTLFDEYAPHYDRSLAKLQNCGPQLVVGALAALGFKPEGTWNVIDAGCGTGLVGELIRPYAKHIIGVDLSQSMLQHAASRGVYDELIHGDMTGIVRSRVGAFDLIVAADALTYCGELGAFLEACADRLRSGGMIIFTLEAIVDKTSSVGYRLNPSGRYAHCDSYVRQCLGATALIERHHGSQPMRHEMGRPVPTHLFVAEKS